MEQNKPQEEQHLVNINNADYVINYSGVVLKDLRNGLKMLPPDPDRWPARFGRNERIILIRKETDKVPESLLSELRERVTVAGLGKKTLLQVSQRCGTNSVRNIDGLPLVKIGTGADLVSNTAEPPLHGVPAFIVGAGPSLDKNVHLLPEAAKRGVIFGVDASAPAIRAAGVEPDLVMTLESKGVSKMMTYNQDRPYKLLACDITAAPQNWMIPAEQRILVSNADPAYNQYVRKLGGVPLAFGGCVSTSAYSLAYFWGCNPIVLVGQDFAYTGGRAYCQNMLYSEQTVVRHPKPEGHVVDLIEFVGCPERGRDIKVSVADVPAWGGGKVESSHEMLVYRDWLSHVQKNINVMTINATEGGCTIDNTLNMTLEDTLRFVERPIAKHMPSALSHARRKWEHFEGLIRAAESPTQDRVAEIKKEIHLWTKDMVKTIGQSMFNKTWDSYHKVREVQNQMRVVDAWMVEWCDLMESARENLTVHEVIRSHHSQIMKAVLHIKQSMIQGAEDYK